MSGSQKPCVMVGAGLAGSLMSIYLARRGMPVKVYERRPDMRKTEISAGRSINLALSTRGLRALGGVGLARAVKTLAIPMEGRMIHDVAGNLEFQPYGKAGQAILSVSRGALNEVLMDIAESDKRVEINFDHKCVDVDLGAGAAVVRDTISGEVETVDGQVVIGADGAFSKVRRRIQKTAGFNFEQSFLGHSYKELTIPATKRGGFALSPNALHIWPRQDFMLIALPNLDRSFTVTLFLAHEGGAASFEALRSPEDVLHFFMRWFPDVLPLMPTLFDDFFDNPTGRLVTIRCDPYHVGDKVLLIGDSAHAVVPFYGQGMNAAFEDCYVLDKLVARYRGNWARILPAFTELRKPNADALAQLSMHNYIQMRSDVRDPLYKIRKKLDTTLLSLLPDSFYMPLYSMVSFSNIPYAEARRRAAAQDRALAIGALTGAAVAAGGLAWYLNRRRW